MGTAETAREKPLATVEEQIGFAREAHRETLMKTDSLIEKLNEAVSLEYGAFHMYLNSASWFTARTGCDGTNS